MSRLRRRCERRLKDVPIPQPFDLDAFCAVVAEHRGRPLLLQPMPGLSTGAPCGLWISVPTADYVFYDPDTSRLHAEHIVLHELAHMLSGHSTGLDANALNTGKRGNSGSGGSDSGRDASGSGGDGSDSDSDSGRDGSGSGSGSTGSNTSSIDVSGGALHRLLPDLDPQTVQTVLGRVSYTTSQEREAEMLASLIRARAAEPVTPSDLPGRTLSRVADVLKFRP